MANKNNVAAALAVMATLGLLAITGTLFFKEIPEGNQQLFNIAIMAVVSAVSTAFGFFLGASVSGTRTPLPGQALGAPAESPPAPGAPGAAPVPGS